MGFSAASPSLARGRPPGALRPAQPKVSPTAATAAAAWPNPPRWRSSVTHAGTDWVAAAFDAGRNRIVFLDSGARYNRLMIWLIRARVT